MKYVKKPIAVDAQQWYQNGDHIGDGSPETEGKVVRYFRDPDVPGDSRCNECGLTHHKHGFIDIDDWNSYKVCPGDWIVTMPNGSHHRYSPAKFVAEFTKVEKDNEFADSTRL